MAKSGLPKVHRYSVHFKATAVRLSELPGRFIQAGAEAPNQTGIDNKS